MQYFYSRFRGTDMGIIMKYLYTVVYTCTSNFSHFLFLNFFLSSCDCRSAALTDERCNTYSQGSCMPPLTAHTPSVADLGGPVIVPVMLVTVPLSNNGTKITAK